MAHYFCIHGHFYQPDRVDPFANDIPLDSNVWQISHRKYSNWNELINSQCYAPNAKLGNFQLMSFDLVRPLAEWLQLHDTVTYHEILKNATQVYERDKVSHVLASSWDHVILPFLNDIDLRVQIAWGLKDFKKRFGFQAQGFWLPETAVSRRVLNELAKQGVRLLILSSHQAEHGANSSLFHKVYLDNNMHIDVAFFHKQLSDKLSFDNAGMADADNFAKSLPQADGRKEASEFILGATDGERYGHHLDGGQQFLNRFLTKSVQQTGYEVIPLTTLHLKSNVSAEARIVEMSSWSCLCGGLQRWRGDCNCSLDYNNNNMRVDGTWKAQLFNAVSTLSNELWQYSHTFFTKVLRNPVDAFVDYVDILQHEMTESDFLQKHAMNPLDSTDIHKLFVLLSMQRFRLASYTSCSTFFWQLDRPEPRIVIHQAKKALSFLSLIHEQSLMYRLEASFIDTLSRATDYKSGITGKDLYEETGHLYATV